MSVRPGPGPLSAAAARHPGWPQVLRYHRLRRTAVQRVPAYRERWVAAGGQRVPEVDVAELEARPRFFLPLGTDLATLPPGPPSAEGIVAAVGLAGALRRATTILECRSDWRPTGRGRFRPDVRVLTLLDTDAPGDPARTARLRELAWARARAGPVVVVGCADQLERLDPPDLSGLQVLRRAGPDRAGGADLAHHPHLGYLAGRVPACGRMHVDWLRAHVRAGDGGVLVSVLRGGGPVRLDVCVPGAVLTACDRHSGPVLGPGRDG